MTAEIAILNKSGIVLASDSASTIGGNKVYNTAKKLFTLDSEHSVGIMVYGNAEFMETPWEIIIGQYRKKIGNITLKNIDEYCKSFLGFLNDQQYLKNQESQDRYIQLYSESVISAVFQETEDSVNFLMSQGQEVNNQIFIRLLKQAIGGITNSFDYPYTIEIDKVEFENKYSSLFKHILFQISSFEEVSNAIFNDIKELIYHTIIRDNTFLSSTGIVIAGYGEDDIFPSLKSYRLYGFIMNQLKQSTYKAENIGNGPDKIQSTIIPFAQDDVVNTVVQGIDPQLSLFLANKSNDFDEVGKEKYNKIIEEMSAIQQQHYIFPLLNMIALLPVDETSIIAETLLNLTSFKRKYTTSVETVGGPIDVLSITPSEGPIWIKRKHYFDIDDNIAYKLRRNKK